MDSIDILQEMNNFLKVKMALRSEIALQAFSVMRFRLQVIADDRTFRKSCHLWWAPLSGAPPAPF
jgi:hypothetical protein